MSSPCRSHPGSGRWSGCGPPYQPVQTTVASVGRDQPASRPPAMVRPAARKPCAARRSGGPSPATTTRPADRRRQAWSDSRQPRLASPRPHSRSCRNRSKGSPMDAGGVPDTTSTRSIRHHRAGERHTTPRRMTAHAAGRLRIHNCRSSRSGTRGHEDHRPGTHGHRRRPRQPTGIRVEKSWAPVLPGRSQEVLIERILRDDDDHEERTEVPPGQSISQR